MGLGYRHALSIVLPIVLYRARFCAALFFAVLAFSTFAMVSPCKAASCTLGDMTTRRPSGATSLC